MWRGRLTGRPAEEKSAPSGEVRAQGNYKSAARLKKAAGGNMAVGARLISA